MCADAFLNNTLSKNVGPTSVELDRLTQEMTAYYEALENQASTVHVLPGYRLFAWLRRFYVQEKFWDDLACSTCTHFYVWLLIMDYWLIFYEFFLW